MGQTLFEMEVRRLRKVASAPLGLASATGRTEEAIESEIFELEERISDLENELSAARNGLRADQREQLDTVLALSKQYDLPLPEDVAALAKREKASPPSPPEPPPLEPLEPKGE